MVKEKKQKVLFLSDFGTVTGFAFKNNQGCVEISYQSPDLTKLFELIKAKELLQKIPDKKIIDACNLLKKHANKIKSAEIPIVAHAVISHHRADISPSLFDLDFKKEKISSSNYEIILSIP